jgi:hypothetical protein
MNDLELEAAIAGRGQMASALTADEARSLASTRAVMSIADVAVLLVERLQSQVKALEERIRGLEARGPGLRYVGVFEEGRLYSWGDVCTDRGSMWHCSQPTTDRPGEGQTSWKLCVKKGRDARDTRAEASRPGAQAIQVKARPDERCSREGVQRG